MYKHYGNDQFDASRLDGKLNGFSNKPLNALWGAVETPDGWSWEIWCDKNYYANGPMNKSFLFDVAEDAKLYIVDSVKSAEALPMTIDSLREYWQTEEKYRPYFIKSYDFDKMREEGYDGILFCLSKCRRLYRIMPCWDTDSIAVWNPQKIIIR